MLKSGHILTNKRMVMQQSTLVTLIRVLIVVIAHSLSLSLYLSLCLSVPVSILGRAACVTEISSACPLHLVWMFSMEVLFVVSSFVAPLHLALGSTEFLLHCPSSVFLRSRGCY
jgi:hypothetical protein